MPALAFVLLSTVTSFGFKAGDTAEFSISASDGAEDVIPAGRSYEIHILGIARPQKITPADGTAAQWDYNVEKREAVIWLQGRNSRQASIQIQTESSDIAGLETLPEIFRILNRAQLPYAMKAAVFDACENTGDPARLLGKLHEMELPGSLAGAVIELVTAGH